MNLSSAATFLSQTNKPLFLDNNYIHNFSKVSSVAGKPFFSGNDLIELRPCNVSSKINILN